MNILFISKLILLHHAYSNENLVKLKNYFFL